MPDNVTVVIRAAGERTEKACYEIIARQVPEANIYLIHEKPFRKAVEKTFQIGFEEGKQWTVAVDADILLTMDAIKNLVKKADELGKDFFEIQGRVLDSMFCCNRNGGPHLYRSKYLDRALELIPKNDNAIRPESYTYDLMAKSGYHYYHGLDIYGIHDFFQYPQDVYRKAFIHAHKHKMFGIYFLSEWHQRITYDSMYNFAVKGFLDGLVSEKAELNVDFFDKITQDNLKTELGNEMNIIDEHKIDIERIMNNFIMSEAAVRFQNTYFSKVISSDSKPDWRQRVVKKAGKLLEKSGKKLQSIVKA